MRNIRWTGVIVALMISMGLATESRAAGVGCPVWMCGTNSPVMDGATIQEPAPAPSDRTGVGCPIWQCGSNSPVIDGATIQEPAPGPSDRTGVGCPVWMCGSNSPIIDGAAIQEPAPDSSDRAGCPTWMCGSNSPVIDGAAIQEPAPASSDRVGCPTWICGSNSPVIDGAAIAEQAPRPSTLDRSFHELNMNGLPNTAGFRVVAVRKGTMRYAVEGSGPAVAARPLDPGAPRLDGGSLVDLVFELRDPADRGYEVRIAATNTTRFWAEPFGPVRTYALTWAPVSATAARPLCTSGANEAILFQGDRYDSLAKAVVATGEATSGWINIACAGTALAKLYLTRHTQASQMIPTTRGERQSMLKMFTADVCGDGTPFTVAGQPLLWADAKGITTFAGEAASIEAIWTEQGAVCLDTPRKRELAPLIAARCQRPGCGGATTAKGRGHVISANPR